MTDETRELNRVTGRRLRWRTGVSLAALAVALTALAFAGLSFAERAERSEQRAEQEEQQADRAISAVDQLCAQVERLGRRCVVEPEEVTEPIPPTEAQLRPLVRQYVDEWLAANPPADGRDAPSLVQLTEVIVREVAAELERNPPPPGPAGESPTPEELRPVLEQIVRAHLLANPPPSGPPGEDGEDGQDGERGPPGPTCPEGTTLQERKMTLRGETWFVCVQDEEDP